MTYILQWLLHSNAAKTAGAAVAGSGLSVAAMLGMMEQKIDKKIDMVNNRVIEYVDTRHDQVSKDVAYVRESQKEIKDLLKVINNRVYELNKREK